MHSLVAPKKPPRVNLTKTVNDLDAAQLTMSSTMVNTIQTDDNDKNTMKATSAEKNTTSLTRQLSVDKATMTKRKHLHFHSPLVKGPMKMTTMQQHQQKQQQLQKQQRDEQYPYSLFANVMSDNTRKANAIITTTPTTGIRGIKLTKDVQTMKTSNVPTKAKTINTKAYYQHDHDDNYSNAHHHSYEHHGRVSKAMSLKETTAEIVETKSAEAEAVVRATGSTNASTRLDRGCTSLMYACQHGDVSEVVSQLSNKVQTHIHKPKHTLYI